MSINSDLAQIHGVYAAGEYSFRGDRYSYEGEMSDQMAKMASIMCRSTSMAVHMQVNMMKSLGSDCGCAPSRGWMVKGREFSVCVIGNHFCFISNDTSINKIMSILIARVIEQSGDKI